MKISGDDSAVNPIELSLFNHRISAICEEMGAVLQRAAFSPNIKERLDFSCALFDAEGSLCAQAAHIPVHLGSMAYAMADLVKRFQWQRGDMVVVNDPYLGGTHLPDITLVAPCFDEEGIRPRGFVVNRAHHADIGADTPGSMPVSKSLDEEGLVIAPTLLLRGNQPVSTVMDTILKATQNPWISEGDFAAQISANRVGIRRFQSLMAHTGPAQFQALMQAIQDYGESLSRKLLQSCRPGVYHYEDYMDDDGQGGESIPIRLAMTLDGQGVEMDFSGTHGEVAGNINCPVSVAAAGVYYAFYCLLPPQTPACAGTFRPLRLVVPPGCLLNARPPRAVAAGNVETSSRVVDVVFGALAQAFPHIIPAASQGSMNNLAMGHRGRRKWDYYETLGGGMGAGPSRDGLSAVQTHLTNTRNTPIEDLEMTYPLRITRYEIRRGSGGGGRHRGGDGLIREYLFLEPAVVSLLTERRRHAPYGLAGGEAGATGTNCFNGKPLPAKTVLQAEAGDRLCLHTPGGGGWGREEVD